VVDDQGDLRIVDDVPEPPQIAGLLGLGVDGREASGAVEGVADGDDQRAPGGVGGGQAADAGVAQERERPRRRAGDYFLTSLAH
jgi:hypothetical protein